MSTLLQCMISIKAFKIYFDIKIEDRRQAWLLSQDERKISCDWKWRVYLHLHNIYTVSWYGRMFGWICNLKSFLIFSMSVFITWCIWSITCNYTKGNANAFVTSCTAFVFVATLLDQEKILVQPRKFNWSFKYYTSASITVIYFAFSVFPNEYD